MSALSELLDGAFREDAARLNSGSFATDRFGAVRGRIARRRAARSAGVGGASVLGIGVLAVGGSQLAGSGMGFGGPGSSATVVCTTTEPVTATGVAVMVPDNAIFAVTDKASGEVFFVGASYVDTADAGTGTPLAWRVDGAVVEMSGSDPHVGTLTLPGGASVELNALTGDVTPSDSNAVLIVPVQEYAQQIGLGSLYDVELGAVPGSGTSWELRLNGGSIGTFTSDGFTTTFTFENGESQMFELAESGIATLTLPGGENLVFRRADGQPVYVGEASAAAAAKSGPRVTCALTTPDPSESASPSPSASPTVSASAAPEPSATQEVSADTPFQCGYVFVTEKSGSDALQVFGAQTTDTDIRSVFDEWYGNQPPTTEVGDSGAIAFRAALVPAEVHGATSTRDPASHESVAQDYGMPSVGFTFVAVRAGAVIGTVTPGANGETPGVVVDRASENGAEEAFMWDLDALTPCGASSIDGAQIYAVAGYGQDGEFTYAWKNVSQ